METEWKSTTMSTTTSTPTDSKAWPWDDLATRVERLEYAQNLPHSLEHWVVRKRAPWWKRAWLESRFILLRAILIIGMCMLGFWLGTVVL